MPTISVTSGWAGPLAAIGAAPVIVQVAGVGPPGEDGPNEITTATETNFVASRLFASNGASVVPVEVAGGLDMIGNVPITQFILSNSDRGSDAVTTLLAAGTVAFAGTVQASAFVGDGSGLTNLPASPAAPAGSDTQVQFNDGGAFGGDAGLTFNKTTDALTVGVSSSGVRISTSGVATTIAASPSAGSSQQILIVCRDMTYKFSDGAGVGFECPTAHFQTGETRFGANAQVGWASTSNPSSSTRDTTLYRASAGVVGISVSTTAPADGAMANNSVAFYTDGSGDLRIKLKDSGGTVRTGTVDLS